MRPILLATLSCLAALTGGCASTSVFSPYPGQAGAYRAALDAGAPATAVKRIGRKAHSADATLYLLEQGRIEQLAGHADASRAAFDKARERFQAQDERARVSASAVAATSASLFANENARPYEGRPYERVFLHQYQALNYLAAGDRDGALVEVRRANQVQVETLAAHYRSTDRARTEAEAKGLDVGRYDGYFSSMDLAAGRVKTGFQNAATFYLSALIEEAAGSDNDAYIDYRKALELLPDNPYLQRDVLRSGQAAGLRDEVAALARRLGPVAPKAGEGELVVYLEEGFVPTKKPVVVPVWTLTTVNNVSFPVYGPTPAPAPFTLSVDGQARDTALLVDSRALAVRSLKDEVPGIIARSFLRLATRQALQRQSRSHDNGVVGLLGAATTVFSLVAEAPDLRSWLTLPGSGQLLRLNLPAGEHALALPGGSPLPVTLTAGRPTLVHLVVLPGTTYSRIYPL